MTDLIEQLERRIERKRQEELPGSSLEDAPADVALLERLRVLLEQVQVQAKMIPDPPIMCSHRDWLTANQKRYVLRYVGEALSLLEEDGDG